MTHENGIHHTKIIVFKVILFQNRKALTRTKFYRTLVRLKITADSAQKSRLTGAVCTDNAINVTTCKLNVYIFVKYSFSELDSKICKCYHLNYLPYYIINRLQRYNFFFKTENIYLCRSISNYEFGMLNVELVALRAMLSYLITN